MKSELASVIARNVKVNRQALKNYNSINVKQNANKAVAQRETNV